PEPKYPAITLCTLIPSNFHLSTCTIGSEGVVTMTDRAGRWIRVSGDTQSEEDQLPDINAYCDDRQYAKGRIYKVKGKSAYKGAQDPDWQKVVADFRSGQIDVVVCWMVDRLDRQNIL